MIKNNIIALCVHIIVVMISWALVLTSGDKGIIIWSFSACLVYLITGGILLKSTVKYAFLSVSSIFIILIIDASFMKELIFENPISWWKPEVAYSDPLYYIGAIIPSFFMYLGILAHRYFIRRWQMNKDGAQKN